MNAQYKLTAGEPLRGNAAPSPIDHAHLARFTLGNRMLESEVLQLFLEVGLHPAHLLAEALLCAAAHSFNRLTLEGAEGS